MKDIVIRDCMESDFDTVVMINDAEVQHTSPMDLEQLHELDSFSIYHKVAEIDGVVAAFILAIDVNASYDSEIYTWFTSRYSNLLYIDRIVVKSQYSGLKIGTLLYNDIISYARLNKFPVITCEYNLIPHNIPSQSFHKKFGFKEVGTLYLEDGDKKVSLQALEIK